MRQHAIPQNILDVEFKIFTKFTLKEFAYLAIGVGTGGVFLFLYAKNSIPGIIALPIFVIFSGVGIFFALVPINDQPADKVLKNFINAIRRPTRRVWLNSKMKKARSEKDAEIAKKTVSENIKDELGKNKIIGISKVQKEKTFVDDSKIDILDEADKGNKEGEETHTQEVQHVEKKQSTFNTEQVTITRENIGDYQFNIEGSEKLPGNINFWFSTKDFKPVENVVVNLKDGDGNMIYANKTPSNGYFLTNRIFNDGVYYLQVTHDSLNFPDIKILLDSGISKNPIKITAI